MHSRRLSGLPTVFQKARREMKASYFNRSRQRSPGTLVWKWHSASRSSEDNNTIRRKISALIDNQKEKSRCTEQRWHS